MDRPWRVLAGFIVLAGAITWPALSAPARDVAWDLGDSLLVMWAIAWDCEQFLAILAGDLGRIPRFFDANIFHPAPLALAHSEHFIAQALQALPVYAATGNVILAYNLLFVSTFALSGFGMYLFVREATGNAAAGVVAGVLFAFAPYRFAQASHLHVLSTQWMPLTLYGLHVYFARGRRRALLGAALSLAMLVLSCGYYALYFTPFAAAYALWETWARRRWQSRVWAEGALAALLVAALTLPVFVPYLRLQAGGFERDRDEIVSYSADVYSYATAFESLPFWGSRLRVFSSAEADLFPGMIPLVLTLVGLVGWRRGATDTRSAARGGLVEAPPWLAHLLGLAIWGHVAAALVVLVERRVVLALGPIELRLTNLNQLLLRAAVLGAILWLVSPPARERWGAFARAHGYFVIALVAAAWLSLGPQPRVLGRPLELASPYGWLLDHVPGFGGVRAPARFGMIVALMLAVLGGYGAATVAAWRRGTLALAALSILFLGEVVALPFPVNGASAVAGYNTPEPRVHRAARAPAVYQRLRDVPMNAVIVELPIGQTVFDLRAVYYSTVHWRRVANGYSGFFPAHYSRLALGLSDVVRHADIAMDALASVGATHIVVHEGAYLTDGSGVTRALTSLGAREIFRDGQEVLMEFPR